MARDAAGAGGARLVSFGEKPGSGVPTLARKKSASGSSGGGASAEATKAAGRSAKKSPAAKARRPSTRSSGRKKAGSTPEVNPPPTETFEEKRRRALKIVRALKKAYPAAKCALRHENAYQLLVATILSAQCTDERVNQVTPQLFARYPTPKDLAEADIRELEALIRSTGFFRAKAANLKAMAQKLVEEHNGEVPRDLEALTKLPGIGRKTANVVLGTAFGIPSGIVVDTHVRRIARLLGLTESNNPDRIEQDLMALIPKKEWIDFSHRLIHHGRKICIARRPKCLECPLLKYCPRVGLPPLESAAADSGDGG